MVGGSRIHADMRSPQVSGRWRRTVTFVGYGGVYFLGPYTPEVRLDPRLEQYLIVNSFLKHRKIIPATSGRSEKYISYDLYANISYAHSYSYMPDNTVQKFVDSFKMQFL